MTAQSLVERTPAPGPAARAADCSPVAPILAVAIATAAWMQGAFYARGQWVLAGLVLLAVVVAVTERRMRVPRSVLAAAGLTVGWLLVRGVAGSAPTSGLPSAAFVAGLVGAAGAAAGCDLAGRRLLRHAVLGVGLAEAGLGVVAVTAHWSGPGRIDEGLWRASTTLTYANAVGALFVLCLVPLVSTCCRRRRLRAGDSAALALLLLGLVVAASRGAVVALGLGTAVLLVVHGPRAVGRVLLPALVGAGIAATGVVPAMPQGSRPDLALALVATAAGLATAAALARRPAVSAGLLLGAGAVAAAFAVGGVHLPGLEQLASHRLHVGDPARAGLNRAVLRQIGRAPLVGHGAGHQTLTVPTGPGAAVVDRYAHDEYLQVLWKSGVVGLAGLLALVAGALRWLRPTRRDRARWGGTVAALSAFAAASALDFLWHLPLLPLVGAVLIGVAVPTHKERP